LLTFTLDTNCIIDIADRRPAAPHILALADAHQQGTADVALVAVSASERQPDDMYLSTYEDFQARVFGPGLSHLTELRGMAYFDLSYWDHALAVEKAMEDREREIHSVLFPNIAFLWSDFAAAAEISGGSFNCSAARRWRNAFCDRQMYWAHDHARRDVFVTSDRNFDRLVGHVSFPAAQVARPDQAVALL
jgi:hypothetical protein